MRPLSSGRWHGRQNKVPRAAVGGLLLAVAAGVLVLALAPVVLDEDDKGLDDLGPAPTYAGTDFIPDSQSQNVADAMSAFMTYVRVSDEVAQDHFHGWKEKVIPLTGGDVGRWHNGYSPEAESAGYGQVGERIVESIRLKDDGYVVSSNNNGMAVVYLGACVDSSGLQVIAPGSWDDGIAPGRYSVSVEVVHWPERDDWGQLVPGRPGRWVVDSYSIDGSADRAEDDPRSPGTQDRISSCVDRKGEG